MNDSPVPFAPWTPVPRQKERVRNGTIDTIHRPTHTTISFYTTDSTETSHYCDAMAQSASGEDRGSMVKNATRTPVSLLRPATSYIIGRQQTPEGDQPKMDLK